MTGPIASGGDGEHDADEHEADEHEADEHDADEQDVPGAALVNAAFAGTAAVVVAGVVGAVAPDAFGALTAVVSGAMFVIGTLALLWGYANGVVRSRDERVTLGGLFFLVGTAPKVVRFRLRLALAVQVFVAVAVSAARPYTSVAFAVLAPMYGLGLLAAWGARFGSFAAKDDPRR